MNSNPVSTECTFKKLRSGLELVRWLLKLRSFLTRLMTTLTGETIKHTANAAYETTADAAKTVTGSNPDTRSTGPAYRDAAGSESISQCNDVKRHGKTL